MAGISDFSSQYYVLDTDVINYVGDDVIVSNEFYDSLLPYTKRPVIHIDTGHYYVEPESAVPADTVAVPNDVEVKDADPVLLAKDDADVPIQ